jgi:sugar phosphate isomerase/epimerase
MGIPRFSIAEYTTPALSFAQDVALYREIGADGIGIDELKLGDDSEDLRRLRASGLQTAGFFPSIPSILAIPGWHGPEDNEARVQELCTAIRRAAPFQPACCVCLTGPAGSLDEGEARELVVAGFRRAARAAADVGVTLALEAIHASIAETWTMVTTIPEMVDLLDEVDEPNVGMAFDLWHLGGTPDLLQHVEEQAARCVHLHLDDRPAVPRSWADRVLPGDGTVDVRGVFGALDRGRFDGWVDVEIFSDDGRLGDDFPDSLWKRDPHALVTEARERFVALWETRASPPPETGAAHG